ncbi:MULTISPECIES: hypothetical protein [unclassified Bradyrhizobium]
MAWAKLDSSRPIDVNIGDRVWFGKESGTEIKFDGVEYLVRRR